MLWLTPRKNSAMEFLPCSLSLQRFLSLTCKLNMMSYTSGKAMKVVFCAENDYVFGFMTVIVIEEQCCIGPDCLTPVV